jgi:hypothetical protein
MCSGKTISSSSTSGTFRVIHAINPTSYYLMISHEPNSIGKPRVSPLLSLNTSAVIRYLICVYASYFFTGRPYHFDGDNRWVCFEKYWSLMKVRNQPTLPRMKIYYYWTNIRKWNYFNTSFIEDVRKFQWELS